jgi:hypothetical protein
VDSQRVLIEEFLRAHPGYFCVDCLAHALGIPASQISMAKQRLIVAAGFKAEVAVCSRCRATRAVITAA